MAKRLEPAKKYMTKTAEHEKSHESKESGFTDIASVGAKATKVVDVKKIEKMTKEPESAKKYTITAEHEKSHESKEENIASGGASPKATGLTHIASGGASAEAVEVKKIDKTDVTSSERRSETFRGIKAEEGKDVVIKTRPDEESDEVKCKWAIVKEDDEDSDEEYKELTSDWLVHRKSSDEENKDLVSNWLTANEDTSSPAEDITNTEDSDTICTSDIEVRTSDIQLTIEEESVEEESVESSSTTSISSTRDNIYVPMPTKKDN